MNKIKLTGSFLILNDTTYFTRDFTPDFTDKENILLKSNTDNSTINIGKIGDIEIDNVLMSDLSDLQNWVKTASNASTSNASTTFTWTDGAITKITKELDGITESTNFEYNTEGDITKINKTIT